MSSDPVSSMRCRRGRPPPDSPLRVGDRSRRVVVDIMTEAKVGRRNDKGAGRSSDSPRPPPQIRRSHMRATPHLQLHLHLSLTCLFQDCPSKRVLSSSLTIVAYLMRTLVGNEACIILTILSRESRTEFGIRKGYSRVSSSYATPRNSKTI